MIIKEATFLTSAADKKGFLRTEKPVIAVCGKSNVGQEHVHQYARKQKQACAHVGRAGRTRLVNYFDFGEFVLADLPGYGYARVSHAEKLKWARLLDDFFAEGGIAHVFALADIRHDPTADDLTMINFLYATQTPFTVIATKADKLAKTRVKEAVRRVAAAFKTGEGNVIAVSGQTRRGREEVLSALDKIVSVAAMPQAEEEDPAAGQEN